MNPPKSLPHAKPSPSIPNDKLFEIENDDGTFDTGSASELMTRADE